MRSHRTCFWQVYLAFDEGEYYHGDNRDEDPVEAYTRPLVAASRRSPSVIAWRPYHKMPTPVATFLVKGVYYDSLVVEISGVTSFYDGTAERTGATVLRVSP